MTSHRPLSHNELKHLQIGDPSVFLLLFFPNLPKTMSLPMPIWNPSSWTWLPRCLFIFISPSWLLALLPDWLLCFPSLWLFGPSASVDHHCPLRFLTESCYKLEFFFIKSWPTAPYPFYNKFSNFLQLTLAFWRNVLSNMLAWTRIFKSCALLNEFLCCIVTVSSKLPLVHCPA